jgi:kumamolisin
MLYIFVCGNGSSYSDTACLSAMSTHAPLALNLSSSWTWTPADPSTDNPYFQKMASQGQSFFQASGDSGAYFGTALWPANAAYVTAVGGTDLTTKSAGGAWASETAWVDGGGGYGTNVGIPSWQVSAVNACSSCNKSYRNVPDVAANANFSFYVCADQVACTANVYGGTSFAAPMWAGYMALANQQAAASRKAPPGFINTIIYPLNLGNNDADFHDITSGSNGATCSSGYNECDGWGSPNGASLISALVAGAPAPPWAFSASLPSGSLCAQYGSEGNFSLSLDQLYSANSLNWTSTLSVGELVTISLSWTLSDSKGQIMNETNEAVGTLNITMPRAPVGTPTLSVSGDVLLETGTYCPFQENLTGTN